MEQLEKRMDAAEQQIKELCEDLNRRFDQLVEMIRKGVPPATNEGDSSKEEEDVHQGRRRGEEYDDALEEPNLYAYRRAPNPTYARDTYKVKLRSQVLMEMLTLKCAWIGYMKWRLSLRSWRFRNIVEFLWSHTS
ncbi:hypothetical protein VPH35_020637 [Triticum aestivum]